jgi:hypothetical protein
MFQQITGGSRQPLDGLDLSTASFTRVEPLFAGRSSLARKPVSIL